MFQGKTIWQRMQWKNQGGVIHPQSPEHGDELWSQHFSLDETLRVQNHFGDLLEIRDGHGNWSEELMIFIGGSDKKKKKKRKKRGSAYISRNTPTYLFQVVGKLGTTTVSFSRGVECHENARVEVDL